MARFMGSIMASDGTSFEMPAETCSHCKGIGYLTRPLVYESRNERGEDFRIRKLKSGDPCPMCRGRGWVGVVGEWRQGDLRRTR
jgi:RecJ-like exonuclease